MSYKNKILITGGLGYIGSHISYLMNDRAIIIDNGVNSNLNYKKLLPKAKVYKSSINTRVLKKIFSKHNIKAVIHLANLKSVNESLKYPLQYYENNFLSTLHLLKSMKEFKINKLIFSSSATVYGYNNKLPLSENSILEATNPYGSTKIMIENLIDDYSKSNKLFKSISLRYFNPIGVNLIAKLVDQPIGKPLNLMPSIIKAAQEKKHLNIFGNKYNTRDGTCIRDYIHVSDLAEAHISALNNLKNINGHLPLNVGLGKGITVLELIKIFEKVNKVKVPYKISRPRKGDIPISYSSNEKVLKFLDWIPKKSYEQMCFDAWQGRRNSK